MHPLLENPKGLEGAMLRLPHLYATWVSGYRWRPYAFQAYIGRVVGDAIKQGGGRILINAPPQRGKSKIGSVKTPVWFLKRWPEKKIMLGSHDDKLASGYGREVRNECVDNPLIGIDLAPDSKARDLWHTPEGGGMVTGGVESGFTGHGGDLVVVDDPYPNWSAAQSATVRRKVADWFDGTMYNRKRPNATVIVINHRMHPDDLTGHILKHHASDRWTHIRLPELAEENDPMGRKPGACICPEAFTQAAVERDRMATPPAMWASLFQQDPQRSGAGNVYRHFGQANIDAGVVLSPKLPLCVSFDFNINPGMHAEIGQYDSVTDQFIISHELHGPRMTLRECLEALVKFWKAATPPWTELHVFGDASGGAGTIQSGDSMYDMIRARLNMAGIRHRIRVPAANPSIVDSVATVNDALCDMAAKSHVRVHPRCERLLVDLREQRANESGQIEKSDLKIGHAGDCLRYMVYFLRPVGGGSMMPTGGKFLAR